MVVATREMAAYCFQVVEYAMCNKMAPPPPDSIPNESSPIFVCFKTVDGDLRGCIGNFSAQPLHQQLQRYAAAAAFEDSRFPKLKDKELAALKCTVSLLHSYEKITNWQDWTIGVHGISIEYDKGRYRGTFLPSVAREQGWDHKQTLEYLCRKAKVPVAPTPELFSALVMERYQESAASCAYTEVPLILKL
jgi:AmmeMemoRadiSam system protein A